MLIAIAISYQSNAQDLKFGVKGGLNYNNFGKGSLKESSTDLISGADNKAGYHIGLFLQAKIPALGFYLRPEINYTELKSGYNWNSTDNYAGTFSLKKVDIPVLLGKNLVGPLHAFIGPAFQFIVDSNFNRADITQVNTDDFTLGIQMGVGLQFKKLGIEVRWERGLNKTESLITRDVINADKVIIDTRPSQIIFGLSYVLNN